MKKSLTKMLKKYLHRKFVTEQCARSLQVKNQVMKLKILIIQCLKGIILFISQIQGRGFIQGKLNVARQMD